MKTSVVQSSSPNDPFRGLVGVCRLASLLCLGAVSAQAGATLTPLHSFSPISPAGAEPYTALVQGTNGNFYGTASAGALAV
jgi:hypothetical protein